jgi:hypothetical protein
MEPSAVCANRLDQVPFHDLHVIQIEEQLNIWTRGFFTYLDGPFRVVTHVPRVVTFTVQRFKADSDPMIRGDRRKPLQTSDAVPRALFVGEIRRAQSAKSDHICHRMFFRERSIPTK